MGPGALSAGPPSPAVVGAYEVEFKVRAAHEPVRQRLAELDVERVGSVRQLDTYLDPPDRDFARTDEALRLRREHADDASRVALTYKGPRVDTTSKTRTELETTVGDADAAAAILEALSFDAVAVVEKERVRFRLGEYTVSLDTVPPLGEFVEVETTADEADLEPARERARTLLADLGLDPADSIRTSYLELLLDQDVT